MPQELKPLVESFNSLLTRLRDAFATQRRFVQDAAHELRTPITAVALQLENVRCDLPEGACKQSFAQLEAGVSRAQRLVDQLLKLSRQEAPVAEAAGAVDLQAQLHESMNALIALADQRNIDLGLVPPAEGQPMPTFRCAPSDLRSVIDNLIENALRYTPEGGVVDVRIVHEGPRCAIEVVDTGPGIPPELHAASVRSLLPRAGQQRARQRPGPVDRAGRRATLRAAHHAAQPRRPQRPRRARRAGVKRCHPGLDPGSVFERQRGCRIESGMTTVHEHPAANPQLSKR